MANSLNVCVDWAGVADTAALVASFVGLASGFVDLMVLLDLLLFVVFVAVLMPFSFRVNGNHMEPSLRHDMKRN